MGEIYLAEDTRLDSKRDLAVPGQVDGESFEHYAYRAVTTRRRRDHQILNWFKHCGDVFPLK